LKQRGLINSSEQSLLIWYLQKTVANNVKTRLGQLVCRQPVKVTTK